MKISLILLGVIISSFGAYAQEQEHLCNGPDSIRDRRCNQQLIWEDPQDATCEEVLQGSSCEDVPDAFIATQGYRRCCTPARAAGEAEMPVYCGEHADERLCNNGSTFNSPDGLTCTQILQGLSCQDININLNYLRETEGFRRCCSNGNAQGSQANCRFTDGENKVECITSNGEAKIYKLDRGFLRDVFDPLITRFLDNSRTGDREIISPQPENDTNSSSPPSQGRNDR